MNAVFKDLNVLNLTFRFHSQVFPTEFVKQGIDIYVKV